MLKYLFFTDSDMDGVGCRIVIETALAHLEKGVDYDIVHCTHGFVSEHVSEVFHQMWDDGIINEETKIGFSDLCADAQTLLAIQATNKIRIWDHHKTNAFALDIVPDATIEIEDTFGTLQSGTSLVYRHFSEVIANKAYAGEEGFDMNHPIFSALMTDLQDAIRAYDTFEFKKSGDPKPKELNILFYMLGIERFVGRYMDRIFNDGCGDLITEVDQEFVDARIESEQALIDSFGINDYRDVDIRGYHTAFTYGIKGANISELAYQFLSTHPEYDAMIGVSLGNNPTFSFRSVKDDKDVGRDLALPLGGGGHPKAAGAPLPKEFNDKLFDMLMEVLLKEEQQNNE